METAKTLINDTLLEIQVNGAEQAVQAVDFQVAMRYLNRMMNEFAADGITLGYTTVTGPDSPITVHAGAISGMIANLAVQISNSYDFNIGADLASRAQDSKRVMTKIATQTGPSSYPDTLPIGSGNEGDCTYSDKFYTDDPNTINTERGGVIGLEQLP